MCVRSIDCVRACVCACVCEWCAKLCKITIVNRIFCIPDQNATKELLLVVGSLKQTALKRKLLLHANAKRELPKKERKWAIFSCATNSVSNYLPFCHNEPFSTIKLKDKFGKKMNCVCVCVFCQFVLRF